MPSAPMPPERLIALETIRDIFSGALPSTVNRPRRISLVMRGSPDVLLQRLENRELNLILIYERFIQDLDGVNCMELLHTPITLMIAPTNPKAIKGATYKDFISEPFVIDAFPNESYADAQRRAKKEIAMYGLKPSQTIISSSRDSAYTEAELGRGFVLSTGVSRISNSSDLLQYPIGVDEHIVCLWNEDGKNPLVAEYAKFLKDAYTNSRSG